MSVKPAEAFPRLNSDNSDSCPLPVDEIQEYLRLEDGDGGFQNRQLRFVRTAHAFDSDYWIWEYNLKDGTHCFVTVEKSGREVMTGMDWNTGKLSPEEYIVNQRRRSGRMQ